MTEQEAPRRPNNIVEVIAALLNYEAAVTIKRLAESNTRGEAERGPDSWDGEVWISRDLSPAELQILREEVARIHRGPHEPDGFQEQCLRTWADEGQTHQQQVMHAALGLGGEAGELLDLLKKHFFKPGRAVNGDKVMDELSDVVYYVAILAHLWGFTFEDMQAHLARKLADGHGWVAESGGREMT